MAHVKRKQYDDDAVSVYDVEFADGPLGIQFETDFYGKHALVKGLVRGSQASRLLVTENRAIQTHAIQTGHILVAVNGADVIGEPFTSIMHVIKTSPHPRVLRFLDPTVLSLDRYHQDPAEQLVNRDEYGFAKEDEYIVQHRRHLRAQKLKPGRSRQDRQWLELIQSYGGLAGLETALHHGSPRDRACLRELLQPLVVGGIPSAYRPALWLLLTNVTAYKAAHPLDYYQGPRAWACTAYLLPGLVGSDHRNSVRACDRPEAQAAQTLDDIEKDVGRTYPEHAYFQGDRGKGELTNVLAAFAEHRPEIGYCQSMNFIVGILVLFLPEEDAFWLLAVLMDRVLPWENYSRSMVGAQVDQIVFKRLVQLQLPELSAALVRGGIDIELVSLQWFLCVFVCTLPLETALRVWDLLLLHGQEVLFATALGVLHFGQQGLLEASSHAELFQRVRDLGTDLHDADAFVEFVHAFVQNERKDSPLDQLVAKVTKLFEKPSPPMLPKLYTFEDIEQWRLEARPEVEAHEREMQRFRETCDN
ncbi:hypothetical protein ACHHYP_08558 [Achlya hypogyna]|uniref:Rab-GAP TBC domain-containing protein n=1 Tax=Achlya hypogyna TaxID=1202772 RepID=A0A1V9YPA9_ACHHY|nr:hypothetical protein ACHHYP_08558 [Achlya hypogyna]